MAISLIQWIKSSNTSCFSLCFTLFWWIYSLIHPKWQQTVRPALIGTVCLLSTITHPLLNYIENNLFFLETLNVTHPVTLNIIHTFICSFTGFFIIKSIQHTFPYTFSSIHCTVDMTYALGTDYKYGGLTLISSLTN